MQYKTWAQVKHTVARWPQVAELSFYLTHFTTSGLRHLKTVTRWCDTVCSIRLTTLWAVLIITIHSPLAQQQKAEISWTIAPNLSVTMWETISMHLRHKKATLLRTFWITRLRRVKSERAKIGTRATKREQVLVGVEVMHRRKFWASDGLLIYESRICANSYLAMRTNDYAPKKINCSTSVRNWQVWWFQHPCCLK